MRPRGKESLDGSSLPRRLNDSRREVKGGKEMEYGEVTLGERQAIVEEGVFDINGNIPAHPGYTGIHRHRDGSYWFKDEEITNTDLIYEIEHRNE